MKQTEWDVGSYQRKFRHTVAYVRVDDGPPSWRYIHGIEENCVVYGEKINPIGQVLCQNDGYKKYHKDLPVFEFLYRQIPVGAYRSKEVFSKFYYLHRRHMKSYKIGLSDESFFILSVDDDGVGFERPCPDIDLLSPVVEPVKRKNFELFEPRLVRIGTRLVTDGETIGFMEGSKCILRHKFFEPFVKPLLENTWQIES